MNANVQITASSRGTATYLQHCFVNPPYKVADITEDRINGELQLMLMCSSPGILDGDNFELKVDVGSSCHVRLRTQSYQRLFPMQVGATQTMNVNLQKSASFVYLPHPSVPHAGAIFRSVNTIHLQENCRLIWGEIITCGRQMKGETFTFNKYHSLTKIFISNKLVVMENLLLQPLQTNVTGIGQLEGFTHQASLIYLEERSDLQDMIEMLFEWLTRKDNMIFGITKTACSGLVVRVLGYKAEQLYDCLQQVAVMLSNREEPIQIAK